MFGMQALTDVLLLTQDIPIPSAYGRKFHHACPGKPGAGEANRTPDPNLGKECYAVFPEFTDDGGNAGISYFSMNSAAIGCRRNSRRFPPLTAACYPAVTQKAKRVLGNKNGAIACHG